MEEAAIPGEVVPLLLLLLVLVLFELYELFRDYGGLEDDDH